MLCCRCCRVKRGSSSVQLNEHFSGVSLQDALVSERRCGGRPDITASFESNDTLWKLIDHFVFLTDRFKVHAKDYKSGSRSRGAHYAFCAFQVRKMGISRWAMSNMHIFRIFHTFDEFPKIFYRYFLNKIIGPYLLLNYFHF
jgi:hypothetical protein